MKMAVINADDFGMSSSISRGIIDGCCNGVVTSVSAVVTTAFWDEALDLIKNVDVDIGVHLTLNAGKPLSNGLLESPLVGNGSSFWKTPIKTPFIYLNSDKKLRCLIYNEFKLQIERLISKGIKPTHLDSHFHIHVFPAIADIVLELGREFRISYLRVPAERWILNNFIHPAHGIISFFAMMNLAGKTSALPFYGLHEAGKITAEILDAMFSRINVPAFELMVHPGRDSLDNADHYASSPLHCEMELDVVTGSMIRSLLREYDMKPVKRSEIPSNYYGY